MVGVAWNRTCTAQRRRVTAGWVSQFPTHPNWSKRLAALACAAGPSAVSAYWRKADVSIATPLRAPTAFEAGPEAAPDSLPDLAEAGAHDAHTLRCQPLSKRCRTPSGSASMAERRGPDPQTSPSHPLSRRRRPPGRLTLRIGCPGAIRTPGLSLRTRLLSSAELRDTISFAAWSAAGELALRPPALARPPLEEPPPARHGVDLVAGLEPSRGGPIMPLAPSR
jgi:hypothetical protein